MSTMKRSILLALAVAAIVAGCGGSSKQSAKACWVKQTNAQIAQYQASEDAQFAKIDRNILITSVNAYAAGFKLPAWLPPSIKPWLQQTKQKCGQLS